jgi:hypothetical protein
MQWIEDRIIKIEQRLEYWIRQIQDLIPQLRSAAQTARNAFQQYQPGTSTGSGIPLFCVLTSTLNASPAVGSGSPSSVSSQSVYKISAGAWVLVSSSATVYNGTTNSVASGKTAICEPNDDGTYSAIGVAC